MVSVDLIVDVVDLDAADIMKRGIWVSRGYLTCSGCEVSNLRARRRFSGLMLKVDRWLLK